ncbi:hypothetical protein BI344_07920 [Chromobacterium sphagni]|uniref:Fimbrial-type adhesion domain-containing protein n=2 Tax=Chromobacterium sphagni TaxID=1903179 RepID=A0ABX3CDM4_9NEIS|nr:hypothetical protein BI344_07920 [Chromobacterium sphagni]
MQNFREAVPMLNICSKLNVPAGFPWLCLLLSPTAWAAADCRLINGFTALSPVVALSGQYAVPRNAAVGSVIASFSWFAPNRDNYADCAGYGSRSWTLTSTPKPLVGGGIYESGVPGVGIQVLNQFRSVTPVTDSVAPHASYAFTAPALVYQLVVTGKVGAGVVSGAALPGVRYQLDNLLVFDAKAGGSAIIVASSCATPSVIIDLGKRSLGDFQGVNKPMKPAAVGFNVAVNGCPAGLAGIQYRIDPSTSIWSAGSGVVALDGGSSATGVGIQLRSGDSGSALQFSTQYQLSAYNPATGGSYSIPLLATYYQTDTTIRPGIASTSLTFTMTYQ